MLEAQASNSYAFIKVWMGKEKRNEFEMFHPRRVVITFNFLVSLGLTVIFGGEELCFSGHKEPVAFAGEKKQKVHLYYSPVHGYIITYYTRVAGDKNRGHT